MGPGEGSRGGDHWDGGAERGGERQTEGGGQDGSQRKGEKRRVGPFRLSSGLIHYWADRFPLQPHFVHM